MCTCAQADRALDRLSELLAAAEDTDSDKGNNLTKCAGARDDPQAGCGGAGGCGVSVGEMRSMLEISMGAVAKAIAVPILEELENIRALAGGSPR